MSKYRFTGTFEYFEASHIRCVMGCNGEFANIDIVQTKVRGKHRITATTDMDRKSAQRIFEGSVKGELPSWVAPTV